MYWEYRIPLFLLKIRMGLEKHQHDRYCKKGTSHRLPRCQLLMSWDNVRKNRYSIVSSARLAASRSAMILWTVLIRCGGASALYFSATV